MFSALAIATVFLYVSSSEAGTLVETLDYPETQLFFNWPWFETTRIAHSRCNASQTGLGRRCVVRLQLDAYNHSKSTSKECKLALKPELPNGFVEDGLMAVDFGKDKAIVLWLETQNTSDSKNQILKTSVIHMFDDCRTFETEVRKYPGNPISLDWHRCQYLSLVVFDDTYELVLINDCASGSECSSSKYSLYKFNAHGKKIAGPEHWPNPPDMGKSGYSFVIPIDSRQPEKGYFNFNENKTYVHAELLVKKDDGYERRTLWKTEPNNWTSKFTATNEAIGFSYAYKNSSYLFWQADQDGRIHTQGMFTLDNNKTRQSNVYNTRDGEILSTAQVTCSDDSCEVGGDRFYFTKISRNGSIKTLEVKYDTKCCCESCTYTRIFENEAGQYCVGRICNSKYNEPIHVDTSVQCYSKDAFSK